MVLVDMAYDPRPDTMEFMQQVRALEAQQKYLSPSQAGFPAVTRSKTQGTESLIVIERRMYGCSDWHPFHSTHSSKDAERILGSNNSTFEYRLRE
ncbi:hypothetical protein [Achromobacter phage Motura]|uniref:Uncharacterized protein n=1 Tax=Achromobacter phage Motura TaxID=2591403 RepID=A0A514CSM7_9CAUD|nr:hypothetical protein H1O15_gp324 [Achromobacter phage Motura]QDH83482.1 hypothetical protein [Achromobacter phage Motura]